MDFFLVRHPPCAISPGTCYGRLDPPLSADGEAALPALVAALHRTGVNRILCSPAQRCRRLAEALALPTELDPRLQELDFGAWEGQSWTAMPRRSLDAWAADPTTFAPPGGESGAAFLARATEVANDLRHTGDRIVITHGGPLRLLPALLRGQPPDLLAPAPPLGTILQVQLNADSAAHSATTAVAPNTSPVNPPI